MATGLTSPTDADEQAQRLDRAADAAEVIYEERLKALLEPEHLGKMVAIHPDSGDHAVGRNSPEAQQALRRRQPSGLVVIMSIGPDRPHPALDRLLGGVAADARRR
jgi:hypothetical protein